MCRVRARARARAFVVTAPGDSASTVTQVLVCGYFVVVSAVSLVGLFAYALFALRNP